METALVLADAVIVLVVAAAAVLLFADDVAVVEEYQEKVWAVKILIPYL